MKTSFIFKTSPRLLIVTPEVTSLPEGSGILASYLSAKAGGLADVSAMLIKELFNMGVDIHIAIPDYRRIYTKRQNIIKKLYNEQLQVYMENLCEQRIHLARDRAFYYKKGIYSLYEYDNLKVSLVFQREVINNIILRVKPDLVHCNDWMTGLIPAYLRKMKIPVLFTIHNIHTLLTTVEEIENNGIDAAEFWENLYFERMPVNYEESRNNNRVDLLTTGIFASHFINTVSQTFLKEIVEGHHDIIRHTVRQEIKNKYYAGCAVGILNAPDESFNPSTDKAIVRNYTARDFVSGKRENKIWLQKRLGLIVDENAPLFFWPSRLDPVQKGCQLLADILYEVVSKYWDDNLEIVFVADGSFFDVFKNIVNFHGFHNRVAVCNFDEDLARLAFAASDFILMPSSFEPCGLPQMIAQKYGSLPVVHDTGGLHDTVEHLDPYNNIGNGFVFKYFDSQGLFWAIDEAMRFYKMPKNIKTSNIRRIMMQAKERFNHKECAKKYIELYEKMLQRPL